MAKRGRPKKEDLLAYHERNKKMIDMREKGYPMKYIASYFGLSIVRTWTILDKAKKEIETIK